MKTEASKVKARPAETETKPSPIELPSVMAPAMVREWAEKSVSQAKDSYERIRSVTEETTEMLEGSIAQATRSGAEYGAKVLDMVRANTNSAFDLARDLISATSMAEVIELSTAHGRKTFDTMTAQSKELTALAAKLAQESTETMTGTMRAGVQKMFSA